MMDGVGRKRKVTSCNATNTSSGFLAGPKQRRAWTPTERQIVVRALMDESERYYSRSSVVAPRFDVRVLHRYRLPVRECFARVAGNLCTSQKYQSTRELFGRGSPGKPDGIQRQDVKMIWDRFPSPTFAFCLLPTTAPIVAPTIAPTASHTTLSGMRMAITRNEFSGAAQPFRNMWLML